MIEPFSWQEPRIVREPICVECRREFGSYEELEVHFQAYHSEDFMKCDQEGCEYEHERANIVGLHKKRVHGIEGATSKDKPEKKRGPVDVSRDDVTVSSIRKLLKNKVKALRLKADRLEEFVNELEGVL